MGSLIKIVGQTFGRLIVVSRSVSRPGVYYRCRCLCGRSTTVNGAYLRYGHTKSCGCLRAQTASKNFRKHGLHVSAEYRIWRHMKTRCLNPKCPAFHRYGGRGIKIHRSWKNSFAEFLRDMGRRPTKRHSIDRIDNDGNYCRRNCRWALPAMQANNKSNVKRITFKTITDSIAGWSRRTGIPYMKLRRRIADGWAVGRALNQ